MLPLAVLGAATGCPTGEPLFCDSEDATLVSAGGRDVLVRSVDDADARATVLLFHGLGESSCTWIDRVEGRRLTNRLRNLGYTVVAPDAGPNTAAWRTGWPGNEDVPEVDAALEQLAELGLIDASVPAVSLGHSNGGAFAPIWAEESTLLDVRAAVNANGWASPALGAAADPPPLLFISARNDIIVPQAVTRAAEQQARAAGHEVQAIENVLQVVERNRFARIPDLDDEASQALFDALGARGVLNEEDKLKSNPRLDRRWTDAVPDALNDFTDDIEEQLHVLYAEHRFSSDNQERIVDFFEDAVTPE